MTLKKDILKRDKKKVVTIAKKGDAVTLISVHGDVWIVYNGKERFSVKAEDINNE